LLKRGILPDSDWTDSPACDEDPDSAACRMSQLVRFVDKRDHVPEHRSTESRKSSPGLWIVLNGALVERRWDYSDDFGIFDQKRDTVAATAKGARASGS
jgi:hypothetical protein